ncbi:MmgE/PrpD family protein [Candidimonas humi]|uniref:MmgE/PrpD family protein n=1 Tax=Candidimonas humi TaxID=683355 RepID=A0ABV8P2F9_9BURK|nr:MmgE/PrpD family protein [Candidimonas humi]MBV6306930.1 MmgE/PrpD family protein [Candidimonas humi]
MTVMDQERGTESAPQESGVQPAGLARELGERIAAFPARPLPVAALHWAGTGLLDTLGVTLAGSHEPAAALAEKSLEGASGPALVLGTPRRTATLDAALINGAASHALDFDDCNNTMGGHPSAPVLSALLPLAEQLGSSGLEFAHAYIVGFETETKLGLAVNFHHYTKGWHPTATLGAFGAAAACARLLRLDGERTATALALAASFASGIKANFGTMTKPLHVGHCARNGLYAARLAASGYTANTDTVFEHKQGFLDVFNGPGTYDTERALQAWADPLDIIEPGIAIKQYPCCGSTHPAIDAMLELVGRHKLAPEAVARVDAAIHSRRLQHTNRPDPASELDAKFSLQYVLARALADGHIGVADFKDGAYLQPRVRALLPRIHVQAYDHTGVGGFAPANHFGGWVQVTLADGRKLAAQVDQPLGRTSANPLPAERLREKFRLCADGVLRAQAVAGIVQAIEHFHTLPRMGEITALIAGATIEI